MKTHKITTILSLFFLTTLGCQSQAVSEPAPPPLPVDESEFFSQAELDQMLAPIALYPDALLSQVLMAATYPLEIVEASRWSEELNLDGENAVEAAQNQDWDISIKALVAFPDLIQLMDEQLSWTRRLGDAFLIQEEQVMETIQELRRRSLDEGNLESLDHLVIKEESDVIIVEPRNVEVVYVPYYNTRYVYGDWWWHDYPPFYWNYPHYGYSHIGFHWSRGFRISTRFYFSFCDWHHRSIYLHRHYWNRDRHDIAHRDSHRYHDQDTKVWNHNPHHRRGVDYRTEDLKRTHDRTSASGVTHAKLPSRTRPSTSAKSAPPPPITKGGSGDLTRNSPQKRLPTSSRNTRPPTDTKTTAQTKPSSTSKYSLPSSSRGKSGSTRTTTTTPPPTGKTPVLSSRSSRPTTSSRTATPTTRSTPSSSNKYSLPSSSRSKSASTTARTPTKSRATAAARPPTTSRSTTTSRPPTTSRSTTTSRPPTTSRSTTSSRPPTSNRSSVSSSGSSSRSKPPPTTSSQPRQSSSGRSSQPTYSSSNSNRSSNSGSRSSSGSTYSGSSRPSSSGSSLGRSSSRSSGRPPSSTPNQER